MPKQDSREETMLTLIRVVRALTDGQRIRIAIYDRNTPPTEREYSETLTDARIIAYGDWLVTDLTLSADARTLYCTIIHPNRCRELLTRVEQDSV